MMKWNLEEANLFPQPVIPADGKGVFGLPMLKESVSKTIQLTSVISLSISHN